MCVLWQALRTCIFRRTFSRNAGLQNAPRKWAEKRFTNFSVSANEEIGSQADIEDEESLLRNQCELVYGRDLTVAQFESLIETEGDRRQIRGILKMYNKLTTTTDEVPLSLSLEEMKKLMGIALPRHRVSYLKSLFLQQKEVFVEQRHSELRRLNLPRGYSRKSVVAHIKFKYDQKTGAPLYGLWRNGMFIRMPQSCTRQEFRLLNASMFAQNLVMDFGYGHLMKEHEWKLACREFHELYLFNRVHKNPFNLWCCNCKNEALMIEFLQKLLNLSQPRAFLQLKECSYMDLFPKEKMIYLSPDADTPLTEYDHDAVLIVGAFADTVPQEKVSLTKATAQGLKVRRLPIDEHITLRTEKQTLALPELMRILYAIRKKSNDWRRALRFVKKRRVLSYTQPRQQYFQELSEQASPSCHTAANG